MLWTYILKLVILLPLVCGLMIGCLYLWRRLESRMPGKQTARLIQVRETMMISPGLRLAVLDFEGKRLLVSVGRGGVQLVDKGGGVSVSVTRRGAGPSLITERSPKHHPGEGRGPVSGRFDTGPRPSPGWSFVAKLALIILALIVGLLIAAPAFAQTPPAAPGVGDAVDRALGQLGGQAGQSAPLSMSLQVLIIMGLLTILPGILLMMTSFTRIVVVLAVLRQALGLQQTPPNQVLIGLALFLSMFVMAPTISQINATAIQPYAAGQLAGTAMIETAGKPLHAFMQKQTRVKDVTMFAQMAKSGPYAAPADIPFSVLLPAFVTSELKTAFQIGFLIFLPFLVIDLVVATVLMSLGMAMMSPTIISLPFKLLLFVLVDGWALTMGSLANSFAT